MHGIVLYALKKFVHDAYDEQAWEAIVDRAEIDRTLFVPVTDYPDEYVFELVGAAADLTGQSERAIQYEFGRWIVPTLVETYGVHVSGDWGGLDLVANVEEYIHEALRAKQLSEFAPPGIGAERLGDDRVRVRYASDREMCDLARGILDGVAAFYDEDWTVEEHRCMHDGAARCEFTVRRTPATAEATGRSALPDGGTR